jgi:hypothetical protein
MRVRTMNIDAKRIDATVDLPRVGFWRRWLATLIDMVIVLAPLQIVAAALFAATAGMVQMGNGFYRACAPAKNIPQSLTPAPPRDSNFAHVCRVSFFGATTGAVLTVGRSTKQGSITTTVSQGYMLDKAGSPITGFSIDWIAALALLVYLVAMVTNTGKTIGDRILQIRVVDIAEPSVSVVPIRKVLMRYLAMTIGYAPMFAVLIHQYATRGGDVEAMASGNFFGWFTYAGAFAFLWIALLLIQIVMKRDPVYDKLAGTAVVRD